MTEFAHYFYFVLDTNFFVPQNSFELTTCSYCCYYFVNISVTYSRAVTSSEILFSRILYREVFFYLNFFFAKLGSFSYSLLINASFLAFDHFLICFSVSIANLASENSQ